MNIGTLDELFNSKELEYALTKSHGNLNIDINFDNKNFYINFEKKLYIDFLVGGNVVHSNIANHISFHFYDRNARNKNANHLREKRCNAEFDIVFDPQRIEINLAYVGCNRYIQGDVFNFSDNLFHQNIISCINYEIAKIPINNDLLYDLYYFYVLKTIYDAHMSRNYNINYNIFYSYVLEVIKRNQSLNTDSNDKHIIHYLYIYISDKNFSRLIQQIDIHVIINTNLRNKMANLMNNINLHYCGDYNNICPMMELNKRNQLQSITSMINTILVGLVQATRNGIINTNDLFSTNIDKLIEKYYPIDGISTVKTWCEVNLPNFDESDALRIFKLILKNRSERGDYKLFSKIYRNEIEINHQNLLLLNNNVKAASILAKSYIDKITLFMDVLNYMVEYNKRPEIQPANIEFMYGVIDIIYNKFYNYTNNKNQYLYGKLLKLNDCTLVTTNYLAELSNQINTKGYNVKYFLFDILPFIIVNDNNSLNDNTIDFNRLINSLKIFYDKNDLQKVNDIDIFKINNEPIIDYITKTYTRKRKLEPEPVEEYIVPTERTILKSKKIKTDLPTISNQLPETQHGGNNNYVKITQALFMITANEFNNNIKYFFNDYESYSTLDESDPLRYIINYNTIRSVLQIFNHVMSTCKIYSKEIINSTEIPGNIKNNNITTKLIEQHMPQQIPKEIYVMTGGINRLNSTEANFYKKYLKYKLKYNQIKNKKIENKNV
ncbi:MAG: hypothetical protein Terrestrivirus2_135 [Terrestrivirus sp.]|uniref:Uncharacterized protein n=1 Tax=Terrestrivirus sp. TaxID=2487775 RepID=A0A3G4ZLB6_9VIRU|nr:MAG: hypothetical protein Terrestrivirus2_135 [Terrestrivirus sp.]